MGGGTVGCAAQSSVGTQFCNLWQSEKYVVGYQVTLGRLQFIYAPEGEPHAQFTLRKFQQRDKFICRDCILSWLTDGTDAK